MRYVFCLCFLAVQAFSQQCAATPEAAAHAAIGSAAPGSAAGYRVVDVRIDAVMRRVWLRVVRCDDASAPAVLVPVAAPLHNGPLPAEHAQPSNASNAVLIHMGDTVQAMFTTSTVRMTLDATAHQSGGVDDIISLSLKRREGQPADEPDHRIRGMVRADRTVEVQP